MKLTIGKKLSLVVGILSVFLLIISWELVNHLDNLNKELNMIVEVQSTKQLLSSQIKQDILKIHRAEKSLILETKPEDMNKYEGAIEQYEAEMFEKLKKLDEIASPEGKEEIIVFKKGYDDWKKIDLEVLDLTRQATNIRASALSGGKGRITFDKLNSKMTNIVDRCDREMNEVRIVTDKRQIKSRNYLYIMCVLAILMSTGFTVFIIRNMTKSIHQLLDATNIVAEGDLAIQVKIKTRDEIGVLADSFNRMVEDLNNMTGDLKQRTTELEYVNYELESFSYSVSHDLRAPLRSINGFSKILLEKYTDGLDKRGKDYLLRVSKATLKMSQLIDDLLTFSRLSRKKMRSEPVNLSHQAEAIAIELKEAEGEGRQVDFVIQKDIVAYGDEKLLYIVLDNLLQNAWKFTGKKPRAKIEFGVTQVNGEETYFVRDNGVGFDMKYTDKLFGAFQRLHSEQEFPGTGIGLATVRRIISRHCGQICAESQEEKGATFYFKLPGMKKGRRVA